MILAIDCGSTNQKVALFESDLRRVADCSMPLEYSETDRGRVEFDPENFWQNTLLLVQRVVAQAGISLREIGTISIASQAQTFTLLDRDGDPLIPFISWADKRAKKESERLTQDLGAVFHRNSSFPSPIPQLQLSKLMWVAGHLPDKWERASRVVSLPGFLALRVAGLHCTDANLAAMSGLFSMQTGSWWEEALHACSARAEMCGELVNIGGTLPARAVCQELEFAPDLRLVFAGNDQTAAAWSNSPQPGDVNLSLGTALVAYKAAGTVPGPFSPDGCWGPIPDGRFYELVTQDHGGAALEWAVDQLADGRQSDFLGMAAQPSRECCFFYPEFTGSYAAWDRRSAPGDMARAVLEGICFSAKRLIERMFAGALPMIQVTGGAGESDHLLQILANVLGTPVRRSAADVLLGAAMMASSRAKAAPNSGKSFYPDASSNRYQELFLAWNAQSSASTTP